MRPLNRRGLEILGVGSAHAPRRLANDHFAAYLDTSDEWIRARTGIIERRVGGTTTSLAVDAGEAAMRAAGIQRSDVELLIVATTTPDRRVPATSSVVQHLLGLRCGAFDLNAACAGFVYALSVASAITRTGPSPVLVIGSETLTQITDPSDRNTAVLMADGAGAVVVGACDDARWEPTFDLGSDGSLADVLYADHGGNMVMNGQAVFRNAVRSCVQSVSRVLDRTGVSPEDIALFVPHQANLRIIEAVAERLGVPPERCATAVTTMGNTSAASIPLALDRFAEGLVDSDFVLFAAFGAGMTWATGLVRWGSSTNVSAASPT